MNHGSSYDDIGAMLQFVIENVYKPPLSYHAKRYLLYRETLKQARLSKRQKLSTVTEKQFYSNTFTHKQNSQMQINGQQLTPELFIELITSPCWKVTANEFLYIAKRQEGGQELTI